MFAPEPIFQSGDKAKIWEKYCGFLNLKVSEFMQIQESLLMEQIDIMSKSPLGKEIMKGKKPATLEDYRKSIPLSLYEDYEPYIGKCQEEYLPIKPEIWAHTSGRGGGFKWVPYTMKGLERLGDSAMCELILACADHNGDEKLGPGSRMLAILAPSPYVSGITSMLFKERYGLKLIPPQEIAEKLDFRERMETGFRMALYQGVDVIGAIGTVLVKMGETFTEGKRKNSFSIGMLRPAVLYRLLHGLFQSKRQHRPLIPGDLWHAKGLACSGTDASIYRKTIETYWGRIPHEIYGATEAGVIATQSWAKKGLTLYPYQCFFEFIPETERQKEKENKNYHPSTVLLNELKPDVIYELVITSFHGMPFFRYRMNDLLKVISLEEEETGIKVPQFVFHSRAYDLIDLYSIVTLDEKTIWKAMTECIKYEDWSARKEYDNDWPVLRIYVEPKQDMDHVDLEKNLNDHLIALNAFYKEAVGEIQKNPVKVIPLSRGSFKRYYEEKQRAGLDLAHLKPSHMNARDNVIQDLLRVSKKES